MQSIGKEIKERYNLEVYRIIPYKDTFIIESSEGNKRLKRCWYSIERIEFIHSAKEYLYKNNFKNIDRYMCTNDEKPFFSFGGNNFTISNMLEGRECNFDIKEDICEASRALASLHKSSTGFLPNSETKVFNDLGGLPQYLNKRLVGIKRLKKIAERGRDKFDYLFLEYVDYFYRQGEDIIEEISDGTYDKLVKKTIGEGIICHHDYTYNNIIIGDKKTAIINFDYCCHELKIYDIANFLRRKMRKCNWDIKEAKIIINEYRKIEDISRDEFFILKLMLAFPQKFWRVVNKYYNSKRGRAQTGHILRLQEVIDEVEYSSKFMKDFDLLK